MSIQEQIYKRIQDKELDTFSRNVFKLLKSEMQKERDKEVSDSRVIKIIKSMVNGCEEMLTYLDPDADKQAYGENALSINLLSYYLPKEASEAEIANYSDKNVDFSEFKNKMQAIGVVKDHFGTAVDGNTIKKIILALG